MSTPHDALVKEAFADLDLARAFLQGALPADLLAAIDLSTLAPLPTTFVDEVLQERRVDLLFLVSLRSGGPMLLHLHLEHQSTPDRRMGRRFHRYHHHVWADYEALHPNHARLPPIISLVLYHGREPWPGTQQLRDEIDTEGLPASAQPYVSDLRWILIDLRRLADVRMFGTAFGRLMLLMLKYVAEGDLWTRLPGWEDLLRQLLSAPGGWTALSALVRYVVLTTPTGPPVEVREFIRTRLGETAMEVVESWGDKLLAQGRREGKVEGRVEGALLTKREVVQRLAQARFGPLPASFSEQVLTADPDLLDRWTLRLLSAPTLEQVLADDSDPLSK